MMGLNFERASWIVLIAALLVAPWLFYPLFLVKVLCYALFACAFNLLLGTCGLMSFGHAAFFGASAYVAGYSAKAWGLPFEAAFDLRRCGGVAARAYLRLHLDPPAGHLLRDDHAGAGATGLLPRVAASIHGQGRWPDRYSARKVLGLFSLDNNITLYYTTAVIFLATFVLIHRIMHSTFGQVVRAIRDNETRATSLGFEPNRYKLLAFVLSAAVAGLAGANKAVRLQARHAGGRALDDIRKCRADDIARRARHVVRAGGGRGDLRDA